MMFFGAQVVVVLLAELAVLPIAHGYFLHVCAWPLMPGQQQLSFGMSYILIHWLLGMVRALKGIPPCSWPCWQVAHISLPCKLRGLSEPCAHGRAS